MDMNSLLEETRKKLESLPSRPSVEALEKAHRTVAAIDKKLASKLESLLLAETPSGVDKKQFKEIQEKKRTAAIGEADADKKKVSAVIDLENQYRHYEEIIRRGETAIVSGDSNSEVGRILKQEAALKLVEDIKFAISQESSVVDWSCRDLESLPEMFGKMSFVRSLDVSRNMLEVVPDSLAGLVNLEVLDLSVNQISQLPDSIGALGKLKNLNLSRNKISALPETICNCRELEVLNLTFNSLEELPDEMGVSFPKLQRLSIGLNKIRYLPSTIGNLTELTHLDAHFNQLAAIPSSIDNLYKLQVLDLSDNFSDLTSIPPSIGNMNSLVELNLSNNQIHFFPLELGKLTGLKKLELEGNPWKDPLLVEIKDKDQESLIQFMRERSLSNPSQSEDTSPLAMFSQWLSTVMTGKFDFGSWLNSILTGAQFPHLLGLPAARKPSSTELRYLDTQKGDHDLEGGSESQAKV